MSSDRVSGSSTESRELLRSTSFEIDDAEAAGQRHIYTNGSPDRRFKQSWRQTPPWRKPSCIWIGAVVAVVLMLGSLMFLQKSNLVEQIRPPPEDHGIPPPPPPPPPPPTTVPPMEEFEKPVDFKSLA
ncbi:MAG: hypothetical protein Q9199_003640 [Rusavskia elegans]